MPSPFLLLWLLRNPLALVWLPEGPRGTPQAQDPWLRPLAAQRLVFAPYLNAMFMRYQQVFKKHIFSKATDLANCVPLGDQDSNPTQLPPSPSPYPGA